MEKGLRQTLETFQLWNVGQATMVLSMRTTSAWLVVDYFVGDPIGLTLFGVMESWITRAG